jgi:hypothetical protein
MSGTMRVTIDAATARTAADGLAASRGDQLVMLSGRMFRELVAEFGGEEPALRKLLRICERTNKPMGINIETDDGSRSVFIAPRSWTQERLRGWVGGRHEDINAMFGAGAPVTEDQ